MDLFSLIRALNPTKVKVGSRPRAPHEVPLLTLTANRVIEMDDPATATDSSGVPPTIERSPAAPEPSQVGVAAADPPAATESRKRGHNGTDVNAPPKSLRRDHADPRPSGSSHGGKSLAAIQLGLASTAYMPEDAPTGVSDPDPLCFADPTARPSADVAQSSPGIATAGDPESENASSPAEFGSPGVGRNGVSPMVAYLTPLRPVKTWWTMSRPRATFPNCAVEDKSAGLIKELEDMRARFSDFQVSHEHLSQQVASLK
nr:hypothetical protein [Tanacetum cinerariifolium]